MLQVANLSKEYPTRADRCRLLSDVSFVLAPGERRPSWTIRQRQSSLLYAWARLSPQPPVP